MKPLRLRELLGILIGDLVVAESQAAKASADFLREAGFIADRNAGQDHWGQLRFVTFSFEVQELGAKKTRTIRVPLLSLLPIPLQQIEQAEYEFFAKVNDVEKVTPAPKKSYELGSAAYGLAQPFMDMMCEIAPYAPETAPAAKTAIPRVRIKLTMRQSDLPAGLASSLRRIEQTSGDRPG